MNFLSTARRQLWASAPTTPIALNAEPTHPDTLLDNLRKREAYLGI